MFELELDSNRFFSVNPDENYLGAYHVRIIEGSNILSELHLVPLKKFGSGHYYQKAFSSYPKNHGHGKLLINTLLQNRARAIPSVSNIYSTSWVMENNQDPSDFITQDAAKFWQKLVQQDLATSDETLARFRIN